MNFRYLKVKVPDGEMLRFPLIPVRLTCNKKRQDLYAIIDSGAEISVFNSSVAKTLNIDVAKGKYLSLSAFAGGDYASYLHQVNLFIQGLGSVDFLAAFTETDKPDTPILGQRGFFDNYQIRFMRYRDQIELWPKSSSVT